MNKLVLQSNALIKERLKEFAHLHKQDNAAWFSELCFCILTANSKAQSAIDIQKEIGANGFLENSPEEIKTVIRKYGHRFHNNKTKYIIEARQFKDIKTIVQSFKSTKEARDFIAKNIKGLGYKEASHFLRNVGYSDIAIIDRHILRWMLAENLIPEIPKTITKKHYLEFEAILEKFSIPQDELDLIIWQHVTGKVLK
ncbi:MAG: N-glycosylase/DNA lyase [Candidatus Babeliales bacterium]|nr:N-glycosylase/DNA lyase [Candidatus Babeliales bacterium]